MRLIAIVIAIGVGLFGLLTGGCNRTAAKAESKGPPAVPVDVATARTEPVQRTVEVVGTLFGEEDATISNKVNGKIIAIYKDVGDRVEPGEPLAQLLRNDYLLDVNQKKAALLEALAKLGLSEMPPADFDVYRLPAVERARLQCVSAESRYNRGKQLHEQRPTPLLSDQDFEDLRTTLDVAHSSCEAEVLAAKGLLGEARTKHAELLVAEQALADTTVRAPSEKYAPPEFDHPKVGGGERIAGEPAGAAAGARNDVPPTQPSARAPAVAAPTTGPSVVHAATGKPPTGPGTAPSPEALSGAAGGSGRHSYVIAARYGNVGELEKAVTPLFRLVDDDPLKFRATVPERYFPEIAVGQHVTVMVEAYKREFPGTVSRINPQVDSASRTFPIEIIVPNGEHLLPPGAFGRGSVQTRVEPGVVFVPASAVVTFAGIEKMFVIEGGKAREVAVTLGDRHGNDVEIKTGLKGDEQVATSGTSRLATGLAVQVKGAGGPGTQPVATK